MLMMKLMTIRERALDTIKGSDDYNNDDDTDNMLMMIFMMKLMKLMTILPSLLMWLEVL